MTPPRSSRRRRSATAGAERSTRRPSSACVRRASSCSSVEQPGISGIESDRACSVLFRRHRRTTPSLVWAVLGLRRGSYLHACRHGSRRTRTSSAAPSSTTSARRSRCCSSRASTFSASRGCGSRRRPRSSPSGGGRGGSWRRLDERSRSTFVAWGAVLAAMNACFYLAIDRLPLAHGRRDRVPAGDRARRARHADVAQRRGARARGGRRLSADRRAGSRASRSALRSRSPTPALRRVHRARRTGSPQGEQVERHRRPRRVDARRARRRDAARRLGGAAGARRSGRARRRDRRRDRVVGDPVRLRPARQWRACERATYALLVSLLPATATAIGVVVLGQVPSRVELVGVALVVGARRRAPRALTSAARTPRSARARPGSPVTRR